jgi:flagellar biogenesis protein FliO
VSRARILRSACLAPLSVALATAPAAADTIGRQGDGGVSLWRVLAALLFCLLIAAGAAFAMRARLRGVLPPLKREGRRLRLIENLRLSHQVDLCLIELDGHEIVVAATPHGASLLIDRNSARA